jgi:hypothetical protein
MDDFGNRIYHKILSYQFRAAMVHLEELEWDGEYRVIL